MARICDIRGGDGQYLILGAALVLPHATLGTPVFSGSLRYNAASATLELGAAGTQWNQLLYTGGTFTGNVTLNGNLTVSGTVNGAGAGGSSTLAGDTDVAITSPADGDRLRYNLSSGKWVNGREPYIVAAFVPGTLSASQTLFLHTFAGHATIPANFGTTNANETSYSLALANATGSTALAVFSCPNGTDPTVSGNWTQIGTITYAPSAHSASFTSTGGTAISLNAGDMVKVVGPTTADATLANVGITIAADR